MKPICSKKGIKKGRIGVIDMEENNKWEGLITRRGGVSKVIENMRERYVN